MDQGILVETPNVPPHGALHVYGTLFALLPVQPRRVQGRPVDGVVVGRQVPRCFRTVNQPPQSKPGPLSRRSSRSPWDPGPRPRGTWRSRWAARFRPPRPRAAGPPAGRASARGHRLHVPPQGGRAHPAAQQVQDTDQSPQADAVYIRGRHQFPEGLGSLDGGHTRRQGRGAAVAGLALPALHLQPPQDDQIAGIGAGSALGAGGRRNEPRPLALGGNGG